MPGQVTTRYQENGRVWEKAAGANAALVTSMEQGCRLGPVSEACAREGRTITLAQYKRYLQAGALE